MNTVRCLVSDTDIKKKVIKFMCDSFFYFLSRSEIKSVTHEFLKRKFKSFDLFLIYN